MLIDYLFSCMVIYCFEGHNGAGKTTMLSILTGLLSATSGDVVLGEHTLSTQIQRIRSLIGFCPQYNVLFDLLTVEEHIKFYGLLKGTAYEYTSLNIKVTDN